MHSFHKQEKKLKRLFLHEKEYQFSLSCSENEEVDHLSLVFHKLTYQGNLINLTSKFFK